MSNETMPEKISPCPFCGSNKLDVRYQLIICENCGAEGPVFDDSGEIYQNPKGSAVAWNNRQGEGETELRRQNAALKEFANAIVDIAIQSQAHSINISGAEIEDIAKKHTIIEGEREGRFAGWMLTDASAMPAPSKAEVAREFWDAVEKRAKELRQHPDYNGYDEDAWQVSYDEARALILKEWEDAKNS